MIPSISYSRVVVSNAVGSLSLACWIILLLPQLLEQWRLKSADGIAIGFISAWLLGDVANFLGSVIGRLRPNVVLLALWFCFSDTLLIISYLYYKRAARMKQLGFSRRRSSVSHQTPLLEDNASVTSETSTFEEEDAATSSWLISTGVPVVFVILIASLSYAISDSTPAEDENTKQPLIVDLLGYFSAIMYLTARIPQIIQNHRRRSVEGLSIGFFILSVVGNLTYAGQIIIYRTDSEWLWAYFPWLLGSLGTILEDSIIFAQFFLYQNR